MLEELAEGEWKLVDVDYLFLRKMSLDLTWKRMDKSVVEGLVKQGTK